MNYLRAFIHNIRNNWFQDSQNIFCYLNLSNNSPVTVIFVDHLYAYKTWDEYKNGQHHYYCC